MDFAVELIRNMSYRVKKYNFVSFLLYFVSNKVSFAMYRFFQYLPTLIQKEKISAWNSSIFCSNKD